MLRSNSPVTLSFPPFRGMTRLVVLTALGCLVVALLLNATPLYARLAFELALTPAMALEHGRLWQLVTYALVPTTILSTLFALLSVWMFGAQMEDERGGQWLLEYLLVSSAGGALLASLLGLTGLVYGPLSVTAGLWPAVLALVLAYARAYPEQELRLFGLLGIKAKFLVLVYLLFYLFGVLGSGDRLGAATALFAALCGFLYLRLVPRRGLRFAATERWYGVRNGYYRSKRQRAARKFAVYMREQGKDVSLDDAGRYVKLEDERRDPSDRGWMN